MYPLLHPYTTRYIIPHAKVDMRLYTCLPNSRDLDPPGMLNRPGETLTRQACLIFGKPTHPPGADVTNVLSVRPIWQNRQNLNPVPGINA